MSIKFRDRTYMGMPEFVEKLIDKMQQPIEIPDYAAGNEKVKILELEKAIKANPGKMRRDRNINMQKIIQDFGDVYFATYSRWPELYASAYAATEKLKMPSPVLYVYDKGTLTDYNVSAYGMLDKLWIFFSNDLIECKQLDQDEYIFIIGHELGHVKFNHSMLNLSINERRLAEYSSDRAGLIASCNPRAGMLALAKVENEAIKKLLMVKESETLRSYIIKEEEIDEFMNCKLEDVSAVMNKYLERYPTEYRESEAMESHPYSHRRFAAMRIFSESEMYCEEVGLERNKSLLNTDGVNRYMQQIVV